MDRHLSPFRRNSLFHDGGPPERAADEGDARLDCPSEMVRIDYLNRVWIIDRGGEFLRIQKERPDAGPRRPHGERALEVHRAPPSGLRSALLVADFPQLPRCDRDVDVRHAEMIQG